MSTRTVRALVSAFAVTLILIITADAAVAQQSATVSGRVTNQQTGEPLAGVRIFLVGTDRSAATDQDGRYQFQNVLSQRISFRVIAIGFETQQLGIALGGDLSAVADFQLEPLVVVLDQVVVTATGEQRRREVANDIARIDAAKEIERGAVTNLSDLLAARASGVFVSPASGTTGSGTKVRIRGANSLSLTNEPLLYIDGIRVDNTAASFGVNSIGVGGQQPSRINDINPEEIESIEIVKGPSAATLYGTEAANAVIDRTFPLSEAPAAIRYLEDGRVRGKLVITV